MSESTIPFDGSTAVMAPPPAVDAVPEPPEGGNRSLLLAVGGVAVLLVLAVAAYFLFFAGGDTQEPAAVTPGKAVAPAPAPAAEPATAPGGKGRKLTHRNFGRDPFAPLIAEAPAGTTDGTTGTTTVPGSTNTTTNTTTNTPTVPTGTGSVGGVTTPVESTAHSFRVVGVSPDNTSIDVKVDGKVYSHLKAGEVFATYFKVVLISGTTNAFQYGEEKFNVLGTKRLTIA